MVVQSSANSNISVNALQEKLHESHAVFLNRLGAYAYGRNNIRFGVRPSC